MNKKEKKLALSTALQSAAADMIVCDDFSAMAEVRRRAVLCRALQFARLLHAICPAGGAATLAAVVPMLALLRLSGGTSLVRVRGAALIPPPSPTSSLMCVAHWFPSAGEDQDAGVCPGGHGRAGGREGAAAAWVGWWQLWLARAAGSWAGDVVKPA